MNVDRILDTLNRHQMALPESERKLDRIRLLSGATRGGA
jgi:hypothetical protein